LTYHVVHRSLYEYQSQAALSLNDACLTPRPTPFQRVLDHSLVADPAPDYRRSRTDWFGNHWNLFAFERPHKSLEIIAEHRLEVVRRAGDGDPSGQVDAFRFPSPFVRWNAAMEAYAREGLAGGPSDFDRVCRLNARLFEDLIYDPKATHIGTPVEEFFGLKRGVCQDYAHLMLALLRSQGIPGRYVSGYLNTLPPPGKEKVVGADASHAWVAAFLPPAGWVDFDPTNGLVVAEDHLTLAWGRDYGDVTPLKGVVLGGGAQKLRVEVTVRASAGPGL